MVAPGAEATRALTAPEGFWTHYGVPASVDWCESNYVFITWIAELFNVVSSAPIALVGLLALWRWHRSGRTLEPRFALCFAGLAMVGLGSMAFHGTLLQVAQGLDELPMVYCSLVMAYCVVVRTLDTAADAPRLRRWQLGFTAYGIGFTWAYLLNTDYFELFIMSFAGVVTYLVLQGGRIALRQSDSRTLRSLYVVAAGAFLLAVFAFWVPERALPCEHALQALQPHAWFHLLAMIGTYGGFLLVIYDRLTTLGLDPVVTGRFLPWVSPRK